MSMRARVTNNIDLIISLHAIIFPEDEFEINERTISWVLWDSGKPAGFCMAYPLKYEPDSLFLLRAGLLPEYRGRGLHIRLILARVRWARRNGMKNVITYTLKNNPQSYYNLQKCGFKLYEPENYYAGELALYWSLSLRG